VSIFTFVIGEHNGDVSPQSLYLILESQFSNFKAVDGISALFC